MPTKKPAKEIKARLPEQTLWDRLSEAMGGRWEAARIETDTALGIPDVFFRFAGMYGFTGWIELKQIEKWNAKDELPTVVPNFGTLQKSWLTRHWDSRACCWLLLHVRETDEVLFVAGNRTMDVGTVPADELREIAYSVTRGIPDHAVIRKILFTGKR